MTLYSRSVQRLLDSWPGKRRFGIYRFLPIFFVLGAALEFSMINWTVGETNFCEFRTSIKCKDMKLTKFFAYCRSHVQAQAGEKLRGGSTATAAASTTGIDLIMPAGVSWGQYMKFLGSAMLAMMAGSQAVHMYFKPLDDLPVYIEKERQQLQKEHGTVNS